jgi:hypothetical protein
VNNLLIRVQRSAFRVLRLAVSVPRLEFRVRRLCRFAFSDIGQMYFGPFIDEVLSVCIIFDVFLLSLSVISSNSLSWGSVI